MGRKKKLTEEEPKKQAVQAEAQPKAPTIAVIIPMHNAAKTIGYSLESLKRQSVQPDQIVIADDGSTDNGLEVAKGILPEAEYVVLPENKGAYHATFEAVRKVTCDYVVRIDSDDEITPNFIAEAKSLLSQYPYDMIEFPHLRIEEGETEPKDSELNIPCDIRSAENCLDVFFRSKLPWYCTGKVFKTVYFKGVELPNMPTTIVLDDIMFIMMLYGLSKSYVYPSTKEGYIYHYGIGYWSGKKDSMTFDWYRRLAETRLIQYNVNMQFLKNIGMEKYEDEFRKLCDFSELLKWLTLLPARELDKATEFIDKLFRLEQRNAGQ